jgi:hypothetical protein
VVLARASRVFPTFRVVTRPACSARSISRWTDGCRGAGPFRDLGEAELKVRVSQQQRKNLARLLRTQDGQQRGPRPSIQN